MAHETYTVFPADIDARKYYQDVRISQLNTKTAYEGTLRQGNYTAASHVLQTSNIDYYGAYMFNMLENRLDAIQTYLDAKEKPVLTKLQSEEPLDVEEGVSWIS